MRQSAYRHDPVFSVKHYGRIAQAIAETRDYAISRAKYIWPVTNAESYSRELKAYEEGIARSFDNLTMNLVNLFEQDNPKFKSETFIAATHPNYPVAKD